MASPSQRVEERAHPKTKPTPSAKIRKGPVRTDSRLFSTSSFVALLQRRRYRSGALDDQPIRLRLAVLGEIKRRVLVRQREVEIAARDRELVAFGRARGDDLP